jgi:hypothetical protein
MAWLAVPPVPKSARGFVFRMWAEKGQFVWSLARSEPGCVKLKLLFRLGSAPRAGSSTSGERSVGAPLFQRPNIRAPIRSAPSWTVRLPALFCKALSRVHLLNSGTSCLSLRKAINEPFWAQEGRVTVSFSRPVRIIPAGTTAWPGWGVPKPVGAGLDIPSRKPKSASTLLLKIDNIDWLTYAHARLPHQVSQHHQLNRQLTKRCQTLSANHSYNPRWNHPVALLARCFQYIKRMIYLIAANEEDSMDVGTLECSFPVICVVSEGRCICKLPGDEM